MENMNLHLRKYFWKIELSINAPYSQQSNGIAERKNQTLKEMMNVLLISTRLPQDLLGEGIKPN